MSKMVGDQSTQPVPAPRLDSSAHKGVAGRVLCLAGSETMPGAAILVLRAAQRAGAGLVTLATFDKDFIRCAAIAVPEVIYIDLSRSKDLIAGRMPSQLLGRSDDVRVAGPGLGRGGRTDELVRRLLSDDFQGPLVLDADGLNVIHDTPEVLANAAGDLVVTPHPGEASRLLGVRAIPVSEEGRIETAITIARAGGCLCVLKGHGTVITDGTRVHVNQTGNPGMATAGSGDVLTGVLGAYLACSRQAAIPEWGTFEATCSAVHIHGLAGDLAAADMGCRSVTASSIVNYLCHAQKKFDEKEGLP